MTKSSLLRWSGISLILAGVCLALAVMIHPSKETPQAILAEEFRLLAGHWFFTFFSAFFLLGLPGLYAAHSERQGRLGLAGFLMVFFGTLFFAVSDDYGFIAPVLARMAPETLDAIIAYPPVAAMDGLFVLTLIPGSILFGIAIYRARIGLGRAGILMAVGAPLFILASGLALEVAEALWVVVILAGVIWGLGIAWAGYALWRGN